MIKFSTNIEDSKTGDYYVLLYCMDSLNIKSRLLFDLNSEIKMIEPTWYVYKSASFKGYNDLEDFHMSSTELFLRYN